MRRRPRREVYLCITEMRLTDPSGLGQEIEKTENETILSSLLMPWELGMSF